MIPYGRQDISEADIEAVKSVLRSDFLTQGPAVPAFEAEVARYCGVSHAVAVNSATSALHLSCLALDLGPGDWLWTVPNTFVASANCALYCGAKVDFVDIDPKTYNLCIERLTKKLQWAETAGRLPKIVIPVHYAGQPCDMPRIHKLAQKYGFHVIEDASHAIGASLADKKIGSSSDSKFVVFSFHPVKIITAGEGGMLMTNDSELESRVRRLGCHGITSNISEMEPRPEQEIWNYQQVELGFNFRMTDIQAALGLSQLERLDEFVLKRREIAKRYDTMLGGVPITTPHQLKGARSSYHLYPVCVNSESSDSRQRTIYDFLRENGVAANMHYIPVHLQPFYQRQGFKRGDFPESERFFRSCITIPMFPALTEPAQNHVIDLLHRICGE